MPRLSRSAPCFRSLLLGGCLFLPSFGWTQTVTYYFADMFFDDGAQVTGHLEYDLANEQVVDLEMIFWEPTDPIPAQELLFHEGEFVDAPFYHDFEPEEPYLDIYTEDFIDFESGSLVQLGAPNFYVNLQLEGSLLDAPTMLAVAITDGQVQGSYQTASLPAFLYPFPGYPPLMHWDRSFASGFLTQNAALAAVPEPAHYTMAAGLLAVTVACWRRRRRQQADETSATAAAF